MKEDQEMKHICKFCSKSFPCGRSLGGHMRSHLINVSSFDQTTEKHSTKKKLPSIEAGSKFSDTLLLNQNKICKECGKKFQSWKSLFSHMNCHSDKISSMNSTREEHSWETHANCALDSTETAALNRKKRSSRKLKRYMTATTCSNSSVVNSSACVSEIEQEQEEVAMSLIILSRDVGNWIDLNTFTDKLVKLKTVQNGKSEEVEKSKSNVRDSMIPRNGHKMENSLVQVDQENKNEVSETELVNKKRNFELTECDHAEKKIKFQCTTCNKSFHSYQALGGHSTSHKKTKELQNQDADSSKFIKNTRKDITIDEFGEKVETFSVSKKLKAYECPICFKIFQSGQALGGHKRSHLIAESKSNNQTVMTEKPIPEIRGFLDLNLPAPVEEESSEHVGFQPWWLGSSHKHEQLVVGLISN